MCVRRWREWPVAIPGLYNDSFRWLVTRIRRINWGCYSVVARRDPNRVHPTIQPSLTAVEMRTGSLRNIAVVVVFGVDVYGVFSTHRLDDVVNIEPRALCNTILLPQIIFYNSRPSNVARHYFYHPIRSGKMFLVWLESHYCSTFHADN